MLHIPAMMSGDSGLRPTWPRLSKSAKPRWRNSSTSGRAHVISTLGGKMRGDADPRGGAGVGYAW
jgi:hypothetical protein